MERIGRSAASAGSSLSGMYLLLPHGSAPGTDVTLSAGEVALVGPETQARKPIVPDTRVPLPHAVVAESGLERDFPDQLAEVLEGTGFVRSPNGFTARVPKRMQPKGLGKRRRPRSPRAKACGWSCRPVETVLRCSPSRRKWPSNGSVGCSPTGGEAVPLLALAVSFSLPTRRRGTPRLTIDDEFYLPAAR
jgi:hypothetical protein